MTPENASVFVVDDDTKHLSFYEKWLQREDHRVIGITNSYENAKQLIADLKEHGAKVDVALLGEKSGVGDYGAQEGKMLADLIRNTFPGVKIISIMYFPQDWSDRPDITGTDPKAILLAVKEA